MLVFSMLMLAVLTFIYALIPSLMIVYILYGLCLLYTSGYRTVVVDESKCIYCGMCYTVCPDYVFSIEEGSETA